MLDKLSQSIYDNTAHCKNIKLNRSRKCAIESQSFENFSKEYKEKENNTTSQKHKQNIP